MNEEFMMAVEEFNHAEELEELSYEEWEKLLNVYLKFKHTYGIDMESYMGLNKILRNVSVFIKDDTEQQKYMNSKEVLKNEYEAWSYGVDYTENSR